jgi:SAM-dependent methyltransferase
MPDAPSLFDRRAMALRAPRVARSLAAADFLHRRAAEDAADRLGDVNRAFPRALIVGAGGGLYAQALRGRFGIERIVQVEPFPETAAAAAAAAPFAETRVAEGAAALGETGFDLVLSGLALHRENDPIAALVQMRLGLKPDGFLLGAALGGGTLQELRAALAEAEIAGEGGLSPRVAPMADIRDLAGLLQRAGFALPAADSDRVTVDYPDPLALMRDLRAMGESNALSARRRTFTRRATLLDACARYVAGFGGPDGRIPATFEIVWLAGWAPAPDQPKALRPGSATVSLAAALGREKGGGGQP